MHQRYQTAVPRGQLLERVEALTGRSKDLVASRAGHINTAQRLIFDLNTDSLNGAQRMTFADPFEWFDPGRSKWDGIPFNKGPPLEDQLTARPGRRMWSHVKRSETAFLGRFGWIGDGLMMPEITLSPKGNLFY